MNLEERYGLFDTIEEHYAFIKSNPEDQKGKNSIQWIAPYMEILKYYADQSEVVVEFGVNQVNSTFAFLHSKCREVHSVDVDFHKNPIKAHRELSRNIWLDHAVKLAEKEEKNFFTYECSSLEIKFPRIDFLFIDSLHTGKHLQQELNVHGNSVTTYLGFHDTKLFGHELNPVINKFIIDNPGWFIEYFDNIGCGLTILKKDR